MSLFLYMVWGNVLISFFYILLYSFSSTINWKGCVFSIVYSCLLFHGLIDHRYVGLFLGSLFCSIDLCSVLVPVPFCFDYCNFVVQSEVREHDISSFVLFSQDCFGIQGLFCFYIKFRIICSSSVKNVMGILIWIELNL